MNSIEALYDRWSATYDADVNRTRDLACWALRSGVVAVEDRDVVELGCGTGRNTAWLTERARSVMALDFSAGMLTKARQRLAGGPSRLLRTDLRDPWPLRSASRDLAVCMLVLEHVKQLEPVFAEAARVLRPGGDLFIGELHPLRQRAGAQARFASSSGAGEVRIPAFLHDRDDYVGTAARAGLSLRSEGSLRDDGAAEGALPRVVWFRFGR